MVGTAANSDPAVQIVSECLSPEWPLFLKADVQTPQKPLKLRSANGHKQTSASDSTPCPLDIPWYSSMSLSLADAGESPLCPGED